VGGDSAAVSAAIPPSLAGHLGPSASAGSADNAVSPPFADLLRVMEQALLDERASAQAARLAAQQRIDLLQQQLAESKSLFKALVDQHSQLTVDNAMLSDEVSSLRMRLDSASREYSLAQEQAAGMITDIKASLEAQGEALRKQAIAFSEQRMSDAAVVGDRLSAVRACLALASHHVQAASRARAKAASGLCEPMHQYLWERGCGWYAKGMSGEQQGPIEFAVLVKLAPDQRRSCWCEGFSKWVTFEEATATLKQVSPCPEFDAVQFHISQVCFLHSRASEALETANPALSAEAALDVMPNSSPNPLPQQQHHYPFEVLEAMWSTVSQRR
jgi:hypothetical protein